MTKPLVALTSEFLGPKLPWETFPKLFTYIAFQQKDLTNQASCTNYFRNESFYSIFLLLIKKQIILLLKQNYQE